MVTTMKNNNNNGTDNFTADRIVITFFFNRNRLLTRGSVYQRNFLWSPYDNNCNVKNDFKLNFTRAVEILENSNDVGIDLHGNITFFFL